MKSAGPTTALGQGLPLPCCSARGWLASRARSRNSTHTEMGLPRGLRRGWGPEGPKHPAALGRRKSASKPHDANEMKPSGIRNIMPHGRVVQDLRKKCRAWNDTEKNGPKAKNIAGCWMFLFHRVLLM